MLDVSRGNNENVSESVFNFDSQREPSLKSKMVGAAVEPVSPYRRINNGIALQGLWRFFKRFF